MTRPAEPVDPVSAILDAFRTHDVVALCDGGHGCEQAYDFRVALIRDPRFADVVNDIVVESGNSLYQEMMDRFISGEGVPDKDLRRAWQDTTQPHAVWDKPVFEGLFREVRAVNAALPGDRQIRVLLGDPPIDWSKIASAEDHHRACLTLEDRDSCPAGIIAREVLAKGRRALVVYGGMHLLRKSIYWQVIGGRDEPEWLPEPPLSSIVALLEGHGARVFSIWSPVDTDPAELQADVASWAVPSLALIRDTPLGVAGFPAYYPHTVMHRRDGGAQEIGVDPVRSPVMQAQFDAILYLGPPRDLTWSRISPELARDPDYLKMRSERLAMFGMGAPRPPPSPALDATLRRAAGFADVRGHADVTPEHLLLSLTEDLDAAKVLHACAVDLDLLRQALLDHLDKAPRSKAAPHGGARPTRDHARVVERAIAHLQHTSRNRLTGADVLVSLIEDDSPATGFLRRQDMTRLDAFSFLAHGVVKAPPEPDPPNNAGATCRVLLLDDDYTPMDFVVQVLEQVFGKSLAEARRIMLDVHRQGSAVCGVYARELAEARAAEVIDAARRCGHPLRCRVEAG